MSSPTARTLKLLRELGFEADVVERRVFRTVTKDFLGIVDVIGVKAGESPIRTEAARLACRRLPVRGLVVGKARRPLGCSPRRAARAGPGTRGLDAATEAKAEAKESV
jgi:hypothetical protein